MYRQPTMLELVVCGREYKNHVTLVNSVHAAQICMLGPLARMAGMCIMHENDGHKLKVRLFPGPGN